VAQAIATQNTSEAESAKSLAETGRTCRYHALATRLRPIAIGFDLRDAEWIVLLETTYDENFRDFSHSQLLLTQAFEHVFRRNLPKHIESFWKAGGVPFEVD
jgi:hypothetical protein